MTAPKKPRPLGLPTTISTAEVVRNLGISQNQDQRRRQGNRVDIKQLVPIAEAPGVRATPAPALSGRDQRDQDQRRESYLVGDTTPSKVDLLKDIPGPLLLEVTQIDPYDHNPRIFANPKRADIEASIRTTGFHGSLEVTRRNPGQRYILAAGGNTTLLILQRLWAETQDERFRYVNCIYQPYRAETTLLADHLGENLNRGDMRFWEVAKGMTDLLAMLNMSTVREQAEALTKLGLRADKTSVGRWMFARTRLAALGAATASLTSQHVRELQPGLNLQAELATRFGIPVNDYWDSVAEPALIEYGSRLASDVEPELDPDAILACAADGLARRVREPSESVQNMLRLLAKNQKLTMADLRMPDPSILAGTGPTEGALAAAEAAASQSADKPTATDPQSAPEQRTLPIGPGLVRSQSTPSESDVGQATPPNRDASTSRQQPASSGHPVAAANATVVDEPDPLPVESDDPMEALQAAVKRVLQIAGLSDTYRAWDGMPLGFFLEIPDAALHPKGGPSANFATSEIKSIVWWSLVVMGGQYSDGVSSCLDPNSAFYQAMAAPRLDESPLAGTDVQTEEPLLDQIYIARVEGGRMRLAMDALREVESRAGRMFEAHPQRWKLLRRVLANLL